MTHDSRAVGPSVGLRANRDFRVVLVGQGISTVGDAVSFTALPLLVLALTGSGVAMGIVGVLQTIPDLLFGLPAGALADRWDRRRMMLYADLGRAVLTALIPLSTVLGLPTMGVILVVTAPINLLRVAFMAGYTAAVPSLVGRSLIGPATSYVEAVGSFGFILGPALAGLLAGTIGPGPTLAIDAASFAISAAMLTLVRRPLRAERVGEVRPIAHEIADGLRFVVGHRILRVGVLFWGLSALGTAPLIPAFTYYVTIDREMGSAMLGFVISAYSIGSLGGALLSSRLSRRWLGGPMLLGTVVSGLLLLAIARPIGEIAMLGLAFAAGVASAVTLISYVTLRASATPDELLGRVGSTARTISIGMQPIGMLLGGTLIDLTDGATTLTAAGAYAISIGVAFTLVSSLRTVTPATLQRPA